MEWEDAAQCSAGLVARSAERHQARDLGRGIALSELRAGWSMHVRPSLHVPRVSYTFLKNVFSIPFSLLQLGYFLLIHFQFTYPFSVSNMALNLFFEFLLSIMFFSSRIFILLTKFLIDLILWGNSPYSTCFRPLSLSFLTF